MFISCRPFFRDAWVFYERDQLYKALNWAPEERLKVFQGNLNLVEQRDDLSIEYVSLLNLCRRPDEAYERLMERNFHPWEGGEGKVTGQYVTSLVEKARAALAEGEAEEAVDLLQRARVYPPNLGEGKLYGAQENNIIYYLGCAYQALGQEGEARACFTQASTGLSDPSSPMYYNDQPPEMIFYQGLSLQKLGNGEEASTVFRKLVEYGYAHLDDRVTMDYFAVSLPDFLVFEGDLNKRNRLHCHYLIGLGSLGLGDPAAALEHFDAVLAEDGNHLGARLHLKLAEQ